jgi:Tol biopolymer transport system component
MSPEQARGEPGDQRSDIFSLGVVLYELVSGRRAFHRETAAETMTAILREEPPALETSAAAVPPGIARVIDHCLEKNPGERFQSASDVAFALENLSGSSISGVQAVSRGGWRGRAWMPWAVAAALALALIALVVSNMRQPAATSPSTTRLTVTLPEAMAIARISSPTHTLAISPDGQRIVFMGALGPGRVQLYLRALDALQVEPIPGTDGARQPFFSPDGAWVAFFTAAGELKKVPLDGGPPVTITRGLLNGQRTFGIWRPDDVIVFAATDTLKQVPASGGTPADLTKADAAKGRELHHAPQLVPETGDILFAVYGDGTPHVDILQRDTRARSTVLENAKDTLLTPSGHLVFVRDGTLMAAPFDARARRAGQPVALPESVSIDSELYETPQLAVSSTGTMAYVPAETDTERPVIGWVTRTGEFQEVGTLPRRAQAAALSPDGQRAAILAGPQLLLFDLRRGVATTIEARESDRDSIGWYTDGKQLTLGGGALSLFDPDTGQDTALTELGRLKRFPSWTPDGRTVAYMTFNPTNDIHVLSRDDGKGPRPLVATDANEDAPAVSPDGRWLAYSSTQSVEVTGRANVFIVRFPEGTGRTQISGNGAGRPFWSRDSRELFFGAPPGVLQSVSVAAGDALQVGPAKTLFPLTNLRVIAAAADGRFLAFREPPPPRPTEIVVVQHWLRELTSLVPSTP